MQQNKTPKKTTPKAHKPGVGAIGKVGAAAPKGGKSMKPLLHKANTSRTHANGTKALNVLPTDQQFGSFH